MRLLHSIRSVNPEGGGPIEAVKQVSAVHQAHRHRVEIVSLDSPDSPWIQNCSLIVHALGPARGGFGYSRQLVPWLKTNVKRYDAVVINGIWQYNSFGVFRALHGSNTPYLVFPHGML